MLCVFNGNENHSKPMNIPNAMYNLDFNLYLGDFSALESIIKAYWAVLLIMPNIWDTNTLLLNQCWSSPWVFGWRFRQIRLFAFLWIVAKFVPLPFTYSGKTDREKNLFCHIFPSKSRPTKLPTAGHYLLRQNIPSTLALQKKRTQKHAKHSKLPL